MTKLYLVSEGEQFPVDAEVMSVSTYINRLVSNLGLEGDESDEEDNTIPVNEVPAPILKLLLEWCQHYHETHGGEVTATAGSNDEDLEDESRPILLDGWDLKFMDRDNDTVRGIIMAANFLDIQPLLKMSCKWVSMLMQGRSPREIFEAFDMIQN